MKVAFRLFSTILLLEMMCLYHYFGHQVQQDSYPTPSSIHNDVDQVSPLEFSLMDLVEYLEGKDGDENSEEDTVHNFNEDGVLRVQSEWITDLSTNDQNATLRLLKFKENRAPLFVLFHSWKYHIS